MMMYDDDDDHVLEDSDPDIDIIVREEVDMEDLDGEKVVDLEFIAKNVVVCLPDTSNSVDVFAHTIENVANYPFFSNEPNEIVDVVSTAVDDSLVVESDSDEDDEINLKPMMADCLTAEEESSGPSGLPRTRNEIINRDDDIRLTEISACVANMPGLKIDRKGDIFVLRAEVGSISMYSSSFSEVGLVMNYVEHEKSVIVKSNTGQTNSLPLNEDSLVCIKPNRNGVNADFMVLGKVSEVFGPVTAPFYLVKLARSAPVEDSSETSLGPVTDHGRNQQAKPVTTRKHIRSRKNKGSNVVESTSTVVADVPSVPSPQQPVLSALEWIQGYSDDEDEDESAQPSNRDLSQSESLATPASSTISKTADGGDEACVPWQGSLVFAVAGQCQYLTAAILMTMRVKGSDASNIYDEEPDDSEVEFSDDEKEMAAKLSRKNKGGTTLPPSSPLQQQRQQQQHHRRPQQPTYTHSQNSSRNLSVSHHPPFQPPLPPGPPPPFSMMMMPGPLPPPHPQFQQQFLPLHPSSQATGYRTTAANIPKGLNDLTYTYKPIQYNFS